MTENYPLVNRCTACGYKFDMAGTLDDPDSRAPQPGDVSICIECQHIMVIGSDMQLRDPTAAEAHQIAGDNDVIRYQRAIAAAKSARKHRQAGGEKAS
jgi:hypothetical protein